MPFTRPLPMQSGAAWFLKRNAYSMAGAARPRPGVSRCALPRRSIVEPVRNFLIGKVGGEAGGRGQPFCWEAGAIRQGTAGRGAPKQRVGSRRRRVRCLLLPPLRPYT